MTACTALRCKKGTCKRIRGQPKCSCKRFAILQETRITNPPAISVGDYTTVAMLMYCGDANEEGERERGCAVAMRNDYKNLVEEPQRRQDASMYVSEITQYANFGS
ncbi:hypothetical protein RB195_016822 [Necator americanus]